MSENFLGYLPIFDDKRKCYIIYAVTETNRSVVDIAFSERQLALRLNQLASRSTRS